MAVNLTAIWRVRPSGNNANGGGFDPGIAGAGTDRSQQNAAQVVFNGTTVTASTAAAGATITLSGYTATAADIGNCLHITGGTNFTTGWYFITAQGGTTWTLDRNVTTAAGSAMTGNMGGGWADFWTNTTSAGANIAAGNIVYILGSGTPNPAAYTFDYTYSGTGFTPVTGAFSTGRTTFANDPLTPGYKAPPDTTGGMPCISVVNEVFTNADGCGLEGLWFVTTTAGNFGIWHNGNYGFIFGCVCDFNGVANFFATPNIGCSIIGCEVFSSTAPTGTQICISFAGNNNTVIGCNLHDANMTTSIDTSTGSGCTITDNIIAKNTSTGSAIRVQTEGITIINNTIDGNTGDGILVTSNLAVRDICIFNNIISNHTGVGKFALNFNNGQTSAVNSSAVPLVDYNSFYNNTANYNLIAAGPHDTALGVTPYVASGTENYTLA